MKRFLCVLMIFALVFSFAACKTEDEAEQTTTQVSSMNDSPMVSLKCENTEVSAGDMVEIFVHIADSPLTACFDVLVYADNGLEYESSRTIEGDTGLILAANFIEEESINYVAVRGIVSSTTDLLSNNVCKIVYKVSDSVVSGDKISVIAQIPAYQLGTDESGDEVYSVTDSLRISNLVLTVK